MERKKHKMVENEFYFCTLSRNLRRTSLIFLLLTPLGGAGKMIEGTDPVQGLEKER
jgi:hypothetical protein